MARVKRATSQLVRWHAEYEDALSEAHDLGVPERALADAGAGRIATRSSSPNPGSSRDPGPGRGESSQAPDQQRSEPVVEDGEPTTGKQQAPDLPGLRDRVPAEIRDVSFPAAVRGYDRRAVDAYVKRVNRVIAELEVSRSPQAAVRNALDRVGAQTSGILQQARESAEEITSSAAAEAEESTGRAKTEGEEIVATARTRAEEILARSRSEAAERAEQEEKRIERLREQADRQLRELRADTETVWQEHGALVDDIRELAQRLEELASAAAARFPDRSSSEREQELSGSGEEPVPAPADASDPQ